MKGIVLPALFALSLGPCLAATAPSDLRSSTRVDHLTLLRPSMTAPRSGPQSVGEAVRDKLRLQLRAAHLPAGGDAAAERAHLRREINRLDGEIRRLISPPSGS